MDRTGTPAHVVLQHQLRAGERVAAGAWLRRAAHADEPGPPATADEGISAVAVTDQRVLVRVRNLVRDIELADIRQARIELREPPSARGWIGTSCLSGAIGVLLGLLAYFVIPTTPGQLGIIAGVGGLLGLIYGLRDMEQGRAEVLTISIDCADGRRERLIATLDGGRALVDGLREALGDRAQVTEWHDPAPARTAEQPRDLDPGRAGRPRRAAGPGR